MKTLRKNRSTDESKGSSALFRALFLFQIELENNVDGFEDLDEVQAVITSIDQLMDVLLLLDAD